MKIFAVLIYMTFSTVALAQNEFVIPDNWALVGESHQDIYIEGQKTASRNLKIYATRITDETPSLKGWAILTERAFENTSPDIYQPTGATLTKGSSSTSISKLLNTPHKQVKNLIKNLVLVDWDNETVVEHEFLCDSSGEIIGFIKQSQMIINICGVNSRYPTAGAHVTRARNIMRKIAGKVEKKGEEIRLLN